MLRRGNAAQRTAVQLIEKPDRLLTAILFWNLMINIVFFALASIIGIRLESQGRTTEAAATATAALFGLIVFSEMFPKTVGVQQPRLVASVVSLPLAVAVRTLDGVKPLINALNDGLQRILLPNFVPEAFLELSDLEQAIDLSTGDKELAAHERAALQGIVTLSELRADELMRPRGQYVSYQPPVHLEDLGGRRPRSGYILVAEPGGDEIVGAIPVQRMPTLPSHHLERFVERVAYMPWCSTVAAVLEELRLQACEAAVVVNELGETIGVITLEDILDTVFDIQASRSARLLAVSSIQEAGENCWHVTGITSLRRLSRHFGVQLAPIRSTTVAGLLQELLQEIPTTDDEVHWSGMQFRVLETAQDEPVKIELRIEGEGGPLP